jgi:hypothetical protein
MGKIRGFALFKSSEHKARKIENVLENLRGFSAH